MSDALSDLNQDQKISETFDKISVLEENFLKKPSKNKAKEIIKIYVEYLSMRGGYNHSPDKSYAQEKISLYGEWLSRETPLEELKKYLKKENSRIVGNLATGYVGFSNIYLEKILINHIYNDLRKRKCSVGEKLFLETIPKEGKFTIKYEVVPKEYELIRLERIKNYTKYLNLAKD
ncbi:MAG: hypothetical protein NUV46_03330 [Nanoarchaeota archaeon]|nr:hypothetical protein [Nanoarchaeota archaeon]